jgi:hypothetical protein
MSSSRRVQPRPIRRETSTPSASTFFTTITDSYLSRAHIGDSRSHHRSAGGVP